MEINQKTLENKVTLSGVGLHTGAETAVTFAPAGPDQGINFKRTDLAGKSIPALVDYVSDTSRGTTLSKSGASVHTVEHLLAALSGLGIDNLSIEVDGPEIPIMDGSSLAFVEAIKKAGIADQAQAKSFYEIPEPLSFHSRDGLTQIQAFPAESLHLEVKIDYRSPVLGVQTAKMAGRELFASEIAPCRTFCFLHELEHLYQANMIKGGDLSNAIVILDRDVSKGELDHLAGLMGKSTVPPQSAGILNNTVLRFENELARHKLLDLVGDLSLLGRAIKGKIIATRPGHTSNIEFAKLIREHLSEPVKEEL